MAEPTQPNRLVAVLWRRMFLLLAILIFLLVLTQSGNLWWALLAGLLVDPVLPILMIIGAGVAGAIHGRRRDGEDEPKVFIPVPPIGDEGNSELCIAAVRAALAELERSGTARIQLVRDIEITRVPDFGRGPMARGLTKVVGEAPALCRRRRDRRPGRPRDMGLQSLRRGRD